MKACVLRAPASVETNPLVFTDLPLPEPAANQLLVRVHACGVCRTDLHVVEGELPPRKSPVIPGHQIVGRVAKRGASVHRFRVGDRVGIAWLQCTCGKCEFCLSGRENLCDFAGFTGYTADGGYAEYAAAPEQFVYPLPEGFADEQAAPLLCAGIIGFRCLRLAAVQRGQRIAFYGFGAAAHVAIQVARHWGAQVYACTREEKHQKLARELGAVWAGGAAEPPPDLLDSSIMFAPAGELVPAALKALKKGGTLILGGIHMSAIPALDYNLLYHERVMRSVANNTREDGEEFLKIAATIPIRTQVQIFPLAEANRALNALKYDGVRGAAVLRCAE
jgi:alcohol dehydrogenase, propanol-preferring